MIKKSAWKKQANPTNPNEAGDILKLKRKDKVNFQSP